MADFKLYCDGNVQFLDRRVDRPIAFAHVTDLHLPGMPPSRWPADYRQAITWWNTDMGRPQRIFGRLLDRIAASQVDFVFFGGDLLDYYHQATADHLLELCRKHRLQAFFQIGNHDTESLEVRFVTHQFDAAGHAASARRLCTQWGMPDLDYTFQIGGVNFIVLGIEYRRGPSGPRGYLHRAQVDWLLSQLQFDGPIVMFHHIPFGLPTLAPRLSKVLGTLASVAEDEPGRRAARAIMENPNVLGTFTGHAHMRSEDPFGRTWQFMTGPAHAGRWRYVRIGPATPPKSLAVAGEPVVDGRT